MTASLLISPNYSSKLSVFFTKLMFLLTEGSFEYEDILTNLISVHNNDNPMIL